ncbi:MAG: hypothetical protein J5902_01535 [Paludibacteraceae bacterium]|nr:hypothetical protein [Paludibacteraceae bacterium]
MKKVLLTLFLMLFVSVAALHAQFFTQMSLLTPHYYPGEVFFKDGHSEEFAELELPRVGKSKLGAKKNAEDKGHIDIEAADIIGIKIWHKNFPDKKHVLYYVHANKALLQSDHQWGNPIMGSAWGVIFECEQNYQIDKKTGDLNFVKFVGGNAPDTPTLYYLVRPDWDKAELLLINSEFAKKKRVAEFFAEKEEIATAIKKGKLKGSDMQYILDEMAGGKKTEEPAKIIPEIKTDSVSNGVVGDDE